MSTLPSLPIGEELFVEQPQGQAPWEREGAAVPAPNDPEAQARAEKWRRATTGVEIREAEREERRRLRAEAKKAKQERDEEERARQLENSARRMYIAGFFALPLLWLVSLFYFHKEHTSPDANPVIKKCSSTPVQIQVSHVIRFYRHHLC